jgi:hypothetical protein
MGQRRVRTVLKVLPESRADMEIGSLVLSTVVRALGRAVMRSFEVVMTMNAGNVKVEALSSGLPALEWAVEVNDP